MFRQNSQQSSVPVAEFHPNVHSELEVLSLKNCSDSLAPNNLPVLYGPFLGRDKDLNEISHWLIHPASSGVTMVNIYGAPAVGKSTLAIHIGYTLAAPGIVVRYIPIQDALYLVNEPDESSPQSDTVTKKSKVDVQNSSELGVSRSYSDIILSWYSLSEQQYVLASAQHLLEWAMGLKNDTLLVLDNCDHFLQSEQYENRFKQALKDLHKASKYLRIIATSRLQLNFLDGFKSWQLNSLDNNSAIELLLQESNSMLTARDSREIAELVGNNPLALKIAAHLIRENTIFKPQEVISELKSNPMKTLSPSTNVDSEKILPILELSYKYLNPITKTCAHYLSNFPGSFSTDAGINILSMSNFTDPESCIRGMFYRSLLEVYEHAGVHRCQFHTLVREFLKYVHQDSHAQTLEKFSWSYQVYYSQFLANNSQFYAENEDNVRIITTLENDIHNIRELFEMLRKERLTKDSVVRVGTSLCSGILTEVFFKNELFRHLQKVIFIFEKLMDMVEVSELDDRIRLIFIKLLNLYLAYIDSASNCVTVCLQMFNEANILSFQRRINSLSVNKELQSSAMELVKHSLWTCGHECNRFSILNLVVSFLRRPSLSIICIVLIAADAVVSISYTWMGRFILDGSGMVKAITCAVILMIKLTTAPLLLSFSVHKFLHWPLLKLVIYPCDLGITALFLLYKLKHRHRIEFHLLLRMVTILFYGFYIWSTP